MMCFGDSFWTYFCGSLAKNCELIIFRLAPESNKNSVEILWHFALIIVCHLPDTQQCLHLSLSLGEAVVMVVLIISTSSLSSLLLLTHSWYWITWNCDLSKQHWTLFSCSDLTRSGTVSLTVPAQLALKHDCSLGECWTLWPFLAFFLRPRLRFLSLVAGFFACGLPLFSEAGGMP